MQTNYPDQPGYKTTGTSQQAAAQTTNAATLRLLTYNHLLANRHGCTADEVAEDLHETVLSIRPRLSELRAEGKIRDGGLRRTNISGRNAVVWVATIYKPVLKENFWAYTF